MIDWKTITLLRVWSNNWTTSGNCPDFDQWPISIIYFVLSVILVLDGTKIGAFFSSIFLCVNVKKI